MKTIHCFKLCSPISPATLLLSTAQIDKKVLANFINFVTAYKEHIELKQAASYSLYLHAIDASVN